MGEYLFAPQYLYGDTHKHITKIFEGNHDFESNSELRKFAEIFLKYYPMKEASIDYGNNLLFYIKKAIDFFKKPKEKFEVRIYNPEFCGDGGCPETIVEIHGRDVPFLVDSVLAELKRMNIEVYRIIHPVFSVKRSHNGALENFRCGYEREDNSYHKESFIHLHIQEQKEEISLTDIKDKISKTVNYVHAATKDWKQMVHKLSECAEEMVFNKNAEEEKEFLKKVGESYFVFLGYAVFDDKTTLIRNSELGIMAYEAQEIIADIKPSVEEKGKLNLNVGKLNIVSPVHRDTNIDYISLRIKDKTHVFIGLFTHILYFQSCTLIPIIRQKVEYILEKSGYNKISFSGKEVVSIIESLPRDELFVIDNDELFEIVMENHALLDKPDLRLFCRIFANSMSLFLFLPSNRLSARTARKVQELISSELGKVVSFSQANVSHSKMSYYHIILERNTEKLSKKEFKQLEQMLDEITSTWEETLESYLSLIYERPVLNTFKNAFPRTYSIAFKRKEFILTDVEKILSLGEGKTEFCLQQADEGQLYLKVYSFKEYGLSDLISMIQNFGFRVEHENVYEISPKYLDKTYLHVFAIETEEKDINVFKDRVEIALEKVFSAHAVDDVCNKLIISAGLSYRNVMLLRSIGAYLCQITPIFSKNYINETLVKHHLISALLVKLFVSSFALTNDSRENEIKNIKSDIKRKLSLVQDGLEDKLLRMYVATVEAMLRTNYFVPDQDGNEKPYISFKIECEKMLEMPEPRPLVEVFVYSPKFEAIHLRTGKVARGGIRWSDRAEDFRTEVLGLVKAQLPKNAVIVPVGSKGGFVVKDIEKLSSEEKNKAGVECYKNFIRGMLDITDNILAGKIIPPKNVVRKDGDDPYLVVAADKGTATFSDIANGISAEYQFWLSDAFASGGSAGYDHKKMGITARGGWVAVQRHLAEFKIDTDKDEFTVVGIGDMSGDVFGNGMLLSDQIKLVAAFNHIHIFIDPNPDKKKTFIERKRLFNLPRSTWMDFNQKYLSQGARIYDRKAKILDLTPEIASLLGIKEKQIEPNQLIKRLLCLDVDLVWNGGIGTYVKSSTETNYDVGDKSNDGLRVDGNMLKCRVFGEGGNLGCTQKGRIEYALNGGKINTDFIDNSAGVDCSDHEVNIKIALNEMVRSHKMNVENRNKLLEEMSENVAELVLQDNYLQTLALTVAESGSIDQIANYDRFITTLEREIKLSRKLEGLPTTAEIHTRINNGQGLTRPELAVIMAYGKIAVYNHVLASDLPDDEYFVNELISYFPTKMAGLYQGEIRSHFLRREIIATSVTNAILNRIYPFYMHMISEDRDISFGDIVRAYYISKEVFAVDDLWAEIAKLDRRIETKIQVELLNDIMKFLLRNTSWLLRNTLVSAKSISSYIADFKDGASILIEKLHTVIFGDSKIEFNDKVHYYKENGVPASLATKIGLLRAKSSIFNIVQIAASNKKDYAEVADLYFTIGERLNIEWLRFTIDKVKSVNSWQEIAVRNYKEELYDKYRRIVNRVLKTYGNSAESIKSWEKEMEKILSRYDNFLLEVKKQESFDLTVVNLIFNRMDALLIKDLS